MKSKQKTGIRELASVFFILKIAENKRKILANRQPLW